MEESGRRGRADWVGRNLGFHRLWSVLGVGQFSATWKNLAKGQDSV